MVKNSDLGSDLKIKVVDYTQAELLEQFEDATSIDRSRFFNMVYQEEFGTAGGLPYGVLLGDYEFGYGDEDVALLRYMAEVGSASHTPLLPQPVPQCLILIPSRPLLMASLLRRVLIPSLCELECI